MIQQRKHSHIPNECHHERVRELAEICDNEYHLSALPPASNQERAARGQARILQAIEKFKELQQIAKCVACLEEINKQITLQEEGLKEIKQVWSL